MSFRNPTQIRLGLEGKFFSKNYRVIGRAVLGTFDAGRLYYWHEYYLETSGGDLATLVFEMTEIGPNWRWFTMFTPRKVFSAEDAAVVRTDEYVTIDGDLFLITRVSRSRIHFTEGRTPEGVSVGQTASYFNAAHKSQLLVVSWTGQEVEFYEGSNVSTAMVASGFQLDGLRRFSFSLLSGRTLWGWNALTGTALALSLVPLFFWGISQIGRPVPNTPLLPAPKPALAIGSSGVLDGVHYQITARNVQEVDEVGRRFLRDEYDLSSDQENQKAELLQEPGQWSLTLPISPQYHLSPTSAAALPRGQVLYIEGVPTVINELFRDSATNASTLYGFTSTNASTTYTVTWNDANILYQRAIILPEKTVLSAFK